MPEPATIPLMQDARREFTRRTDRIEELVSRIENAGDPATRAVAQELLQAVIELHGIALDRILDAVAELPSGEKALRQIAADGLVSNVLSLHGIHPVAMEERVAAAVEKSRSYLKAQGGDVQLVSIEDGTVQVRIQSAGAGCGSTAARLQSHVEDAIGEAAPEITAVVAETVSRPANSNLVILQTS